MAKATKGSADPRAAAQSLSDGDHTTATARHAPRPAAGPTSGATPTFAGSAAAPEKPGKGSADATSRAPANASAGVEPDNSMVFGESTVTSAPAVAAGPTGPVKP